ncbi:MAG TPA: hypothetical protein PLY21_14945 [Spirochaetota bacterium]|nr:hypothetical protein [Spirochaetota bacterium]
MEKITFKHLVVIVLLGLAFALGFYIDGREATVNNLSSDQWNILPVCIKLDHPELYKGDLFANDPNDIDYYTPFFVSGVRFCTKFSNDNYIEGLNKLNFLINFFYTVTWALFFYFLGMNLPVALIMTILVRGILWLPGFELWGAGALWTALPRTAFLALLPLPLLLMLPAVKNKYYHFAGALLLGIISNFHPISGLGLCLSLWLTYCIHNCILSFHRTRNTLFQSFIVAALMIIGLSPYLYTYFIRVLINGPYDHFLFNEMLSLRIGEQFQQPLLAISKFGQVKWILFIMMPILAIVIFRRKLPDEMRKSYVYYLILLIVVMSSSVLTVPTEQLIRKTGVDLHMSFQLIRNVKFVMVPVFVFYTLIIIFSIEKLRHHTQIALSWGILSVLLVLLVIARYDPLKSFPLVGDDFLRSTLPNAYSIRKEIAYNDQDLDTMFKWINTNTGDYASFIGPSQLRTACRRSVIFDFKGASMLIEGNPGKYIEWAKRDLLLTKCKTPECEFDLYHEWGADYWLTDKPMISDRISPLIITGRWHLYSLK